MYCPTCGASVAQSLSYCNRCGVKLSSATNALENCGSSANSEVGGYLAIATGFTAVGGFFLVFMLVRELLKHNVNTSAIFLMTLVALATVLAISALMIRLLARSFGYGSPPNGRKDDARSPEINGRDTAQIDAPREPLSSVTDHTTRHFGPVLKDRIT